MGIQKSLVLVAVAVLVIAVDGPPRASVTDDSACFSALFSSNSPHAKDTEEEHRSSFIEIVPTHTSNVVQHHPLHVCALSLRCDRRHVETRDRPNNSLLNLTSHFFSVFLVSFSLLRARLTGSRWAPDLAQSVHPTAEQHRYIYTRRPASSLRSSASHTRQRSSTSPRTPRRRTGGLWSDARSIADDQPVLTKHAC